LIVIPARGRLPSSSLRDPALLVIPAQAGIQ